MAFLTEIEPTFSSSKPATFFVHFRHDDDDDDDDYAFSVEVVWAAVSGKALFVLGNAMRIFGFGTLRYHIYTVIESACET